MGHSVKTYNKVNRQAENASFSIERMEDVYSRRKGRIDEPHRHAFYTVLLVEKAKGHHFIDFNEYPLSDAQVFFVAPGQIHQVVESQPSQGFSILFSTEFLVANNIPLSFIDNLNLFQDYGEAPPIPLNPVELEKLLDYSREMLQFHTSDLQFKAHALGSLLRLFLIQCNNLCTLSVDRPEQQQGNHLIREFKELVNLHYAQWHATSQYADALHVSPDHLNRVIKNSIGKTAKEYIQSRITVAAKRMLYFSELSSKEIGYELGFSEPANFSAFFKNCTGKSPSVYRKK